MNFQGLGSQGARTIYITPTAGEDPSLVGLNNSIVEASRQISEGFHNIDTQLETLCREIEMASHLISAFQRGSVEEGEFIKAKLESIEDMLQTRVAAFEIRLDKRLDLIESKTFIGILKRAWKAIHGS